MGNFIDIFQIAHCEVVSIIGSGGKTSLLNELGKAFADQKVLLATTTKMAYPLQNFHAIYTENFELAGLYDQGITAVGIIDEVGKFSALESKALASLFPRFDQIFLESDGSKNLPLKAWNKSEPVIPEETTTTIGVIPIHVIGRKLSPKIAHRFALFKQHFAIFEGEKITVTHLSKIISTTKGLFREAKGRKILCFNQVDTEKQLKTAKKVVQALPTEFFKQIERIVATSMLNKRGVILWQQGPL
ncbi:selenium cofactor biosynthesis protein YqeC [Listeria sp. PSOL-1]|uniref:selenium cofactor biosynthesis protein YqeC n=1 Tax=Listeria sp. PSOL-1 TaxID=1844999 RepID=UPI0013D69AC2|nr:selenium cofactor biosynthesis protein YqeC [Listeria sp. PSOL-1]